jgi:hydrogenase-1 operon protein HyaF
MNLPFDIKPFPIPVVGLGSQPEEDEQLDYLSMPQGMSTYRAPSLPEPEELAAHVGAVQVLEKVLKAVQAWRRGEAAAPLELAGLAPADLKLVNQVLGEGEVSAQVTGADGRARIRIQEAVFAGVWRVMEAGEDGRLRDHIEVGAVPAVLRTVAQEDARGPAPAAPAAVPPGVLNAVPVLVELAEHRQHWRAGQPAEVVNLTLLPVGPEDIAYLDHCIGTGRVVILSRGYGNCRITNAQVANTWRVVYYNSQDAVILNSVEVVDMPEVACAAAEDLADTEERLVEVLQWMSE